MRAFSAAAAAVAALLQVCALLLVGPTASGLRPVLVSSSRRHWHDPLAASTGPEASRGQSSTYTDFGKLLKLAEQVGNFLPAVTEAQKWLDTAPLQQRKSASEITWVIKIFSRAGLADDAARVIDVVLSRGGEINTIHYNAALTALKQHKRHDKARALFERMKSAGAGCQPDQFTLTTMISVFAEQGDWEQGWQLYSSARNPDAILQTAILQCASRCGKVDELLALFSSFSQPRPHPMFHAALAALGAAGRWQEAVDVYRRMLGESGADSIARYNIVRILQQHGQAGLAAEFQQQGAAALVGGAGAAGGATMAATAAAAGGAALAVGTAAAAAAAAGAGAGAGSGSIPLTDLLREARRSGDYRIAVERADAWCATQRNGIFSPGGLQSVIQIYGEARLADRVLSLQAAMARQAQTQPERPPSLKNYNALLVALVKCGQADEALRVFALLPLPQRDAYSYSGALMAHQRKGNWQAALALFESMETEAPGVDKPAPLYNTLLSSLARAGQWRQMLAVFRQMGPKADSVSRAVVAQGLGKAGRVDELVAMRAELGGAAGDGAGAAGAGGVGGGWRGGQGEEAGTGAGEGEQTAVGASGEEEVSFGGVLRQMPVESKAGTLLQKLAEKPAQGGIHSVAKFYAMAGLLDQAIAVLEQSEEGAAGSGAGAAGGANSTARMAVYNEILVALGSIGDWERAYALFVRMVDNNVPRSLTTYRAVAHVLSEFGDEDCMDLVEQQAVKDGVDLKKALRGM